MQRFAGRFRICRRELCICLLLAGIVSVLYAPVRQFDFIDLDDPPNVNANPHVQAGLTRDSVLWALTSTEDYWRPLTRLSHLLDVELFGMDAGAHHRTNVILHAANVLLLFGVLRRMTGAMWPSAFVAAVFALHPLQVESVAWVTERKDVLSALLWMLTLWAYAVYAARPSGLRYVAVFITFALGLAAKPMLITLPFVLLLLDCWPLRRMAQKSDDRERVEGREQPVGEALRLDKSNRGVKPLLLILEKLPLLSLAAVSAVLTLRMQQAQGGLYVHQPLMARLCSAVINYSVYVRRAVWPFGLAAIYPPTSGMPPIGMTVAAAAVLLAITAIALWKARQYPFLLAGWFWFVGTLVPVIGILRVGAQPTADRFTYIPLIGLLIMTGWGVPALFLRFRKRKAIMAAVSIAVLAACTVLSRQQIFLWRDSLTLYEHSLRTAGPAPVTHLNLGGAYLKQERWNDAFEQYHQAFLTDPSNASACTGAGLALRFMGKPDEAVGKFEEALRLDPLYFSARDQLAQVMMMTGRPGEAARQYRLALELSPGSVEIEQRLQKFLSRCQILLDRQREVLQKRPDDPTAMNNLAWLLATGPDESLRSGAEAVKLAERVCELTGHSHVGMLDTLAAAYAESGRFEEAVKTAERAAELAHARRNGTQARKIESRMNYYRQGRPFRE